MGLNWDQINQLVSIEKSSGQEGLLANIINMFFDSMESERPKLVQLLESENYGDASKLAHSMKSSSRNVGADELAETFQYIEDVGAGRDEVASFNRQSTLDSLDKRLTEAISELKEVIN